tara:strand:- start:4552 stop:5115 length:564 start_codon:yes stop_codon:yes gene_type:complete
MPMPIINPLVKLFKITIILLVLILALEVAWFGIGSQLFNVKNNEVVIDYATKPPDITQIAVLDTFRVVVSRSLFNWNRRPKTIDQQPVSEEGLSSRWLLSGVVNTGNAIYALFGEVSGDRRLRLEQGMYLEKWKLSFITSEQVRLNSEDEEEVFYLKETARIQTPSKNRVKKTKVENREKTKSNESD